MCSGCAPGDSDDFEDDNERCPLEFPCVFCLSYFLPRYGAAVQFYQEMPDFCGDRPLEEMRRYLYRNVACEARKLSDIARHIPQMPGWA